MSSISRPAAAVQSINGAQRYFSSVFSIIKKPGGCRRFLPEDALPKQSVFSVRRAAAGSGAAKNGKKRKSEDLYFPYPVQSEKAASRGQTTFYKKHLVKYSNF
jgi:hypothetical protein